MVRAPLRSEDGAMNDTTSRPDGTHDAPPPPPPSSPRRPLGSFGDVRRSRDDRVAAGVCGGVARHFDIDPVIVRVLTVVLCFVGLAGLILYVAGWLFLPADGDPRSNVGEWFGLDEREQQVREIGLVSAGVLAVVAVVGDGGWGAGPEWLFWVTFWVVAPVAIVLWLVRRASRGRTTTAPSTWEQGHEASVQAAPAPGASAAAAPAGGREDTAVLDGTDLGGANAGDATPPSTPPGPPVPPVAPPPPRRPREPFTWVPTLLALSVIAIVGAVLRLTQDPRWTVYVAVALGVVGLALVLSTFTRGGAPLVVLGLALVPVLVAGTVLPSLRAGDRDVTPTSAAQLEPRYEQGFGRFTLDLSNLDQDDLAGRDVEIDTGLGETLVVVPEGVAVATRICTRAGDLSLFDERTSGIDVCLGGTDEPAATALTLDVQHTAGRVEVSVR